MAFATTFSYVFGSFFSGDEGECTPKRLKYLRSIMLFLTVCIWKRDLIDGDFIRAKKKKTV